MSRFLSCNLCFFFTFFVSSSDVFRFFCTSEVSFDHFHHFFSPVFTLHTVCEQFAAHHAVCFFSVFFLIILFFSLQVDW